MKDHNALLENGGYERMAELRKGGRVEMGNTMGGAIDGANIVDLEAGEHWPRLSNKL